MAKLLSIDWINAKNLNVNSSDAGVVIDVKPALKAAKKPVTARPALLFVHDSEMKRRDVRALAKKVFGSEQMGMVSDFFHVVKTASNEKLPAGLHVTDAKGHVVAMAHLTDKPKDVMKTLSKGFASSYEGSLEKAIAAYSSYLDKLQAAEDAANLTPSDDTMNDFKALQKEAARVVSPKAKKTAE